MEINSAQQTTQLPHELLKLIFSFCEDLTLAISIPRVSKLFKKLSDDNGDVWRQRTTEKFSAEEIKNLKNQQTSWKQLGFVKRWILFPLSNGWSLGKFTWAETGALFNTSHYFDEDNNQFIDIRTHGSFVLWGNDERPTCARVFKTPEEWKKFGFSETNSYNDFMRVFRLNGFKVNIITEPRVKPMSRFGTNTFKATIGAEVQIDHERKGWLRLMWKRKTGNADTKGTLWDAVLSPL